jgi:hypothetical protein
MADTEVENILREIRERVRAESAPRTPPPSSARDTDDALVTSHTPQNWSATADALSRMEANLATSERAWNRLPPLMSNRTGWLARLELWLKRLIKRATHWFTWEQVNFNSAVHHSLRDARAALSAYEKRLADQEAGLAESNARLADYESRRAHDAASLRDARAELALARAELEALRQSKDDLDARFASHRSELAAHLAAIEARIERDAAALREALDAGFAQMRAERHEQLTTKHDELREQLRARAEQLLDEQRVSFRQLSLEAGEAAVAQDRARRQLEARLEAIEKSVKREL